MTNDNKLLNDSSDEDEDEEAEPDDVDICDAFELTKLFQLKYKVSDEAALTLRKDYVLSLCQNSDFTRLAVGISNGWVKVFDINERGLTASSGFIAPPLDAMVNVCGVRFLDENCLLIGTTNGTVRLLDLRTTVQQTSFQQTVRECTTIKPLTCFDCNANGRIICAGTEQFLNNVYLLFFDVRERREIGGYFESHQDDVTSVRFHGQNPDILCSGSTDGLINIFDIRETEEDDALLTTINTESSVQKLNWHRNANAKDVISCITHTNDFMTYESDEGDLIAKFDRAAITAAAKRKNPANCNLINAHSASDGIFLLAGTNFKKGEILRSLRLQDKHLQPDASFTGNKQIVRASIFDLQSQTVVTGGESGIITMWTPQLVDQASNSSNLKAKTITKSKKSMPY